MADDEQISVYDEIEIEDMTFDETLQIYHYPCPCGDRFEIALCDLRDGMDIGVCPSCSLMIRVIFDVVSLAAQTCRPAEFGLRRRGWKEQREKKKKRVFCGLGWLTDTALSLLLQDNLPKPPEKSDSAQVAITA